MRKYRIIPLVVIGFILTGAISSCKDDPVTPPRGKDSCDTCVVCDTCDTTDTVVVTPNDTTSHDFVWTEYNLSGESSIGGAWVFDDTTIWVAGRDLYRLGSQGWERITIVGSGANIFGFTTKDAWFVYGGIPFHFNGSSSKDYRLHEDGMGILNYELDGSLRAAWGTSSNDMFFVGDKGTIVHFDGANWRKFPKVTAKNLRSVWGTSSNDIWAAGFNSSTDESVLLHYDGSIWTEDPLSVSEGTRRYGIGTVWTCDSAGHKITVLSGATVIRNTDGGPWRSDSGKILSSGGFVGIGVKGNSANDLLAAGGWGFIAHWNGRDWYQYKEFFNPGNPVYGASTFHIKGNTAVVAGSENGSWIAVGRRVK
jgi:hypothetical protein